MTKGAASITIVTLLDKPSRRTKAITADLAGFVVPDEFVVGMGWTTASSTGTCRTSGFEAGGILRGVRRYALFWADSAQS